jgi:O-acetyl-ADP-ribose deacetylase (regulator of RNase III)
MPNTNSENQPSFETLFVDENPDVISALAACFGRRWAENVRFKVGNIFAAGPGALVSPTNSFGDMSGGFDLQLSMMFPFLQDRIQTYISLQPSKRLSVGSVVWAETGDQAHPLVIFTPTFRTALDMATSPSRIYRAAFAVFTSVLAYNSTGPNQAVDRILMTGFGTGLGEMEATLSARKIFHAYSRAVAQEGIRDQCPAVLGKG